MKAFRGAVIDTGAARSCIGIKQANAYARFIGGRQNMKASSLMFKFGDTIMPSKGKITIALPTVDGNDIVFCCDIVPAGVPLLLGLDVLKEYGLIIDVRRQELRHENWTMPLFFEQNHLWARWILGVQYTEEELQKLHRHFQHPSAEKLYKLLRRVNGSKLPKGTLKVLQEIQQSCEPCSVIDRKQIRFQVGSANDGKLIFNREISLDIMKIGTRHVLHVVDLATHFSAAEFLDHVDVESVWNALLTCWVLIYAGQPDIFFMDQGSVFTSNEWKNLADENGVALKFSGIQHHNGIAICERYHAPLRNIYRKIEIEIPHMDPNVMLKTAVKAMNDTLGPEGLVPSLLVFGVMPRYAPAGLDDNLPGQKERLRAIRVAKEEYFRISNQLRIKRALRAKIPEAADRVYKEGDRVRVYREDLRGYSDPVTIVEISDDNRMVTVETDDGDTKLYSVSQVKPYEGTAREAEETVDKVSRVFGPWCEGYHSRRDTDYIETYVTEVIEPHDPRASNWKMKEAIAKEIKGLLDKGTFKIVLRRDVPEDANILGGRFVLAIKEEGSEEERYKARFVILGHRDKDKMSLVHSSPNLHQQSVRLLLALASIMGFSVWTQDITQAYLQGSAKMMRDIYLDANKEFNLSPDQMLQVMKPLYGLADSGDRWHHTFKRYHIEDLKMIASTGDLSLYTKHIGDHLVGISGVYVDDTLQTGSEEFKRITKTTGRRFGAPNAKSGAATFMGMQLRQDSETKSVELSMDRYIEKLQVMKVPGSFEEFRSVRQKLAWTTNCRPDVACAVAKLAQVTPDKFDNIVDVKAANRITRHLKRRTLTMKYPNLDRRTLHIRAYADASHANNHDLSSQLGIIICLCDANDHCSIIGFKSYKCHRITRSAVASECHALADAFDYAYMLKYDLEDILRQSIPLQMLTDSQSLFRVIVRATTTKERRLMIDVAATREAYERHDIADIGLIRSEYNLADCMTKTMYPKQLMQVMQTAILTHPVEQWVIRHRQAKEGVASFQKPGSVNPNFLRGKDKKASNCHPS